MAYFYLPSTINNLVHFQSAGSMVSLNITAVISRFFLQDSKLQGTRRVAITPTCSSSSISNDRAFLVFGEVIVMCLTPSASWTDVRLLASLLEIIEAGDPQTVLLLSSIRATLLILPESEAIVSVMGIAKHSG